MNPFTALLSLVPSWVWAALVAALTATTGIQAIRISGLKADVAQEQRAHQDTKLQYAEKARQAEADARQKEFELTEAIDQQRKVKDNEISNLRRDVRNLRDRVSHLATRPASDPGAEAASFGQAPVGCPGPVLYRDTAEALIDEAERADVIRIELKACYAAWDKARDATGSEAQ